VPAAKDRKTLLIYGAWPSWTVRPLSGSKPCAGCQIRPFSLEMTQCLLAATAISGSPRLT